METGKPRKRRKQRKRKHQRLKQKASRAAAAAAAGAVHPKLLTTDEIWGNTYTRLLQWHQTQVKFFCQQQQQSASSSEEENSADEEEEEMPPEVNVERVDNNVEQVDADYLEFLAVTLKHQEELKRMRAAQQTTTTAEN